MPDLETPTRLTALRDQVWAARQAARLTRSCNPRTEFEAGSSDVWSTPGSFSDDTPF